MKIIAIATGLVLAAGIGASADAQTTVTRTTVSRTHTGPVRHGTHRVCSVSYRHHAKVRSCRTVRY